MFKKIISLISLLSTTIQAADFSARFTISNETDSTIVYTNLQQQFSLKIAVGERKEVDFDGASEVLVPAYGDNQERVYNFSSFIIEEGNMKALRVTCGGRLCTERLKDGIETALYYIKPETIRQGITETVVAGLPSNQVGAIGGVSNMSFVQFLRKLFK